MSISIQQLTPSTATHPGEILKDELEVRNITHKEFAHLTGIPLNELNEIIQHKKKFTFTSAFLISNALQMDINVWHNIQNNYELDLGKIIDKKIPGRNK